MALSCPLPKSPSERGHGEVFPSHEFALGHRALLDLLQGVASPVAPALGRNYNH